MNGYQMDLFPRDTPRGEDIITEDNVLVLVHPRKHPRGAEARERMLARVREIDARKGTRKVTV